MAIYRAPGYPCQVSVNNGPLADCVLHRGFGASVDRRDLPDPRWSYVDPFGHFHANAVGTIVPPTLGVRVEPSGTRFECRACRAPVAPEWARWSAYEPEGGWAIAVQDDPPAFAVPMPLDLLSVRIERGHGAPSLFGFARLGGPAVITEQLWLTLDGYGPLAERLPPTPS